MQTHTLSLSSIACFHAIIHFQRRWRQRPPQRRQPPVQKQSSQWSEGIQPVAFSTICCVCSFVVELINIQFTKLIGHQIIESIVRQAVKCCVVLCLCRESNYPTLSNIFSIQAVAVAAAAVADAVAAAAKQQSRRAQAQFVNFVQVQACSSTFHIALLPTSHWAPVRLTFVARSQSMCMPCSM